MARSRNIKPGFFSNDTLADVPPIGRLLFIALWTVADREGRLENRPKKIKAECLPYDDCDVEKLLMELCARGFVVLYEVYEVKYIQVVNFTKHQNPHMKEQPSTIPAPDIHQTCTIQAGPLTDSLNLIPLNLKPEPEDETNAQADQRISPSHHQPDAGANPVTATAKPQPTYAGPEQLAGYQLAAANPQAVIDFEALFAIWPAKKKKLQARQAYTIARNRGVAHETMTAGARRFAKYHAEQKTKEQFLQPLDDWINSDGWTATNGKPANKKPQV